MGIYRTRTKRATRKKKRIKKIPASKRTSVVKKRKLRGPTKAARGTSKKVAKKKVGGKPTVVRKRTVKKVTAKKRAVVKRAPPKRAAVKKPVKRRSKPAAVRTPVKRLTKAQKIAREKRRLAAQLQKVRAAEERVGKVRRKDPKRKSRIKKLRKKTDKRKKEIGEQRIKAQLVIQELPRKTPKQRKLSREREAARQRANFRRLFRIARERGELPAKRREPRRIDSRRHVGRRRVVRIEQLVNDTTVEGILYACGEAGKELTAYSDPEAVWSATICFSALGEELVGSNTKLLGGTDPDARFFQTEGFDATGDYNDYPSMFDALGNLLQDMADRPRTLVYLHWVELRNFTRRS